MRQKYDITMKKSRVWEKHIGEVPMEHVLVTIMHVLRVEENMKII